MLPVSNTSSQQQVKHCEAINAPQNKTTKIAAKALSFELYKERNLEGFEEFKRDIQQLFPEATEDQLSRSYHSHCQSMYNLYLEGLKNPYNDPGRMI